MFGDGEPGGRGGKVVEDAADDAGTCDERDHAHRATAAGTDEGLKLAGPADAPGPFGNYLLATTHTMQRSTNSSGTGPVIDSQDWVFQAGSGERLELHIKYEHGVGNKTGAARVIIALGACHLRISR